MYKVAMGGDFGVVIPTVTAKIVSEDPPYMWVNASDKDEEAKKKSLNGPFPEQKYVCRRSLTTIPHFEGKSMTDLPAKRPEH